jgi:hypothetical protein
MSFKGSPTTQAVLRVVDRYFFDLEELERYGSDVKIVCFFPYNPEKTEDKIGSRKTGKTRWPKSKGKGKNHRQGSFFRGREFSHRRHVAATKVLKILEDLKLPKV